MIRLVLMSVVLGSVAQILMKTGADRLGPLLLTRATLLSDLAKIIRIPEFWMAMLLFGISSLLWVKVLSKSDLTYAYPLNSLSYLMIVLLSAWLLNEALTFNKILGAAVIMAGILVMHK